MALIGPENCDSYPAAAWVPLYRTHAITMGDIVPPEGGMPGGIMASYEQLGCCRGERATE